MSAAVASRKATANLANEAAAAQALRESIASLTDDGETIRDTIEGGTNLHEAITKVMEFIRDDEILISGIEHMLGTLSARKNRLSERVDFYRAAIEQAMLIGEIQSMELPDATVTVRRVPPKLEVTDESAIPATFWQPQDPKLDRKALTDALKSGQEVPGAVLGNGGVTLSIRRS